MGITMADKLVFLDANVVLESTLKDRPQKNAAQKYLAAHRSVISPLTAHLVMYFGQKDGLRQDALTSLLKMHSYADLGTREVSWALEHCQGTDFEDALQIACALGGGAASFATLDEKLAKRYQEFIPVTLLGEQ